MNSQAKVQRRRPRLRLLFNENLPWRVAAALWQLELHCSYIGQEDVPEVPKRGSPDEEILEYAKKANQIVVTINYDMVLLSVEREQRIIWIDPFRGQLSREEITLLAFKSISEWENTLKEAKGPICLRAIRSKTTVLSMQEAGELVRKRMSRISKSTRRERKAKPVGPLFD